MAYETTHFAVVIYTATHFALKIFARIITKPI